jgi:hypothetical protein
MGNNIIAAIKKRELPEQEKNNYNTATNYYGGKDKLPHSEIRKQL